MNRQGALRKTFGIVMIIVSLLLVACGNGDGDATPTASSGANRAVPTLPAGDATAEATNEISEDNLTVVTPNVPTTDATAQGDGVADLTGDSTPAADGTAPGTIATDSTPVEETVTSDAATAEVSTPAAADATVTVQTPEITTATPETLASVTAAATPASGGIVTAGDGTGGSGQPGERSSNIAEPVASPVASPVAALEVEGCEVTTVPPFTGTNNAYVTNAEVFFRQGPGAECTPVYEAPLGEGQAVVVTSAPVAQAADGSLWVQVEVDGVPGWVSLDFLVPVA